MSSRSGSERRRLAPSRRRRFALRGSPPANWPCNAAARLCAMSTESSSYLRLRRKRSSMVPATIISAASTSEARSTERSSQNALSSGLSDAILNSLQTSRSNGRSIGVWPGRKRDVALSKTARRSMFISSQKLCNKVHHVGRRTARRAGAANPSEDAQDSGVEESLLSAPPSGAQRLALSRWLNSSPLGLARRPEALLLGIAAEGSASPGRALLQALEEARNGATSGPPDGRAFGASAAVYLHIWPQSLGDHVHCVVPRRLPPDPQDPYQPLPLHCQA
mmetsp:Transcript_61933/g.171298  ORF Transcript_61933/g.171298 Transcript_61933/m.171298 type:complete len:278 (-) Transcript_61933:963-1796(-)